MLIGFPLKEYEIFNKEKELVWVSENLIDEYVRNGYSLPEKLESRMSYATPAWLPKETSANGGILCLDDYNRNFFHFFLTFFS